jgi:NAD(P)-dependent dehydrogenase (short-subunit alcohol dehydrogenase family)
VVITGASTGIGEACAHHLAGLGMRVFAGVRKEQDGERLRSAGGERVIPVRIDVTDHASIHASVEEVESALGGQGLGGLVNNAGVAVSSPQEFLPAEELRRQLEVNVVGAVETTRAFMPLLRAGQGRIVNMGSVGGRVALPFVGPYAASKAALASLTEALRQELRPWRMWAAVVEPGAIATPIWEKGDREAQAFLDGLPPEGHRLYGEAMDAGRRAAQAIAAKGLPPEDVARVVEHALTSPRPRARYLVGREAKTRAAARRWLPARAFEALVERELRRGG